MGSDMQMRIRSAFRAALCLAALVTASCGEDPFLPGVPTSLSLTEPVYTFSSLGQNHQLVAVVTDGHGDPIEVPAIWSTSDQTIVKVNGAGMATAVALGEATVTVMVGGMTATSRITVGQVPAHIRAIRGEGQSGPPAAPLPNALVVEVTDALNHRVEGAVVTFAPGMEGGSVAPAADTTDVQGRAETSFTLGADSGSYTMVATVAGTAISTAFHVQVGNSFDIELMWLSEPTPSVEQSFTDAEARWESIILGDLPDDYALVDAYSCGDSPALDRPIDDVLIFVTVGYIDGPGGILGQAGPCFVHEVGYLPAIGAMIFDSDDLAEIEANGLLTTVVTHEMGHVLGYGTMWNNWGLLADAVGWGGTDPHFTGAMALERFDSAGGLAYPNAKVPVEDLGGAGTADAHWRESVFGNEAMTGYVDLGANPLSSISIASMGDLGYVVDTASADGFLLPGPAPLAEMVRGTRFSLRGDVLRLPIGTIGKRGRPNGVYRR